MCCCLLVCRSFVRSFGVSFFPSVVLSVFGRVSLLVSLVAFFLYMCCSVVFTRTTDSFFDPN